MPDQKTLTAREISSIVKACGEGRVKSLKFGDLHIDFYGIDTDISHPETTQVHYLAHDPEPLKQEDAQGEEEPDLDLLAVEDPSRWQRLSTQE